MSVRKGVGIALLGVAAVAVLGSVVMGLWNGLMPPIFGLRAIHFWQAVGLLVLSRILFGGFHRAHGGGFQRRRHMMERWERMTPEEREKFKQGFRGRHCGCAAPTPPEA
jgi:hypothetical protein